jgi:hypothetical protein
MVFIKIVKKLSFLSQTIKNYPNGINEIKKFTQTYALTHTNNILLGYCKFEAIESCRVYIFSFKVLWNLLIQALWCDVILLNEKVFSMCLEIVRNKKSWLFSTYSYTHIIRMINFSYCSCKEFSSLYFFSNFFLIYFIAPYILEYNRITILGVETISLMNYFLSKEFQQNSLLID